MKFFRVYVDYRTLNACTQNDHFLLLFITLILEKIEGHARDTFMDGYAGYNKIPIAIQNIHKTAFTTHWVTFVWVVMPLNLYDAPVIFQRLVMYIFTNLLYKFMTVFINDFSTQSNASQHIGYVREFWLGVERCN